MTSGSRSSASWTTARPLPVRRSDVKTSSRVKRWRPNSCGLLVEVEVARWALLEPQPVVLRRLLEEVRRLLQQVLALLVRGDVVRGRAALGGGGVGGGELRRRVRRLGGGLVVVEPRAPLRRLALGRRLRRHGG